MHLLRLTVLILLFPLVLFSQSEFTFLQGLQPQNGKTYLVAHSGPIDTSSPSFRFDVRSGRKIDILPSGSLTLEKTYHDIAFWDDEPGKFILLEDTDKLTIRMRDFRGNVSEQPRYGETQRLYLSKSEANIVFRVNGPYTFVSKDSGLTFSDTLDYPLLAVHPQNAGYLYAVSPKGRLLFSNDSGKTFLTTDDNAIWSTQYAQILFDSNGKDLFAWTRDSETAILLRSDDSGKPFSWQEILRKWVGRDDEYYGNQRYFYRYAPLRIAMNSSQSGTWYYSLGRNIYKSRSWGESFSLLDKMPYKITGLYAAAGSDSIFASTPYFLYGLKDSLTTIATLLQDNSHRYFPLTVGNKWFYTESGYACEITCESYWGIEIVHASGDSIFENGKTYIALDYFYNSETKKPYKTEYLRLDSARARVYKYDPSYDWSEFLLMDFAMTPYDSLTEDDNYEKYLHLTATTQYQDSVFNGLQPVKSFQRYNLEMPLFRMAMGLGKIAERSQFDFGMSWMDLQGALIDGVVYGDTLLVGIDDSEETQPATITLQQNYPNPFNPSTTIAYELPRREQVKIEIFDNAGRRVATLVDAPRNPGRHELSFNATQLASGVYYYRLKAGPFVQTKKMLLIK